MTARAGDAAAASGNKRQATLLIAVLGVVYGDIGTSPIYALRECFAGGNPLPVTELNVLGILSLMLWSLILVISLKYMAFVLRADNHGEGGIFALLALLRPRGEVSAARARLLLVGVFGASLLYGGVMITPAISVLSAVEGLHVATPALSPYVIPLTVVILLLLFLFQRHGTARVGSIFGPFMLVWFLCLAVLGISGIVEAPRVLQAVSPQHAVEFFIHNRWTGYLVLYAVFLVTTGGEALYADLGHFGRRPIRLVWFGFVLPALLINYFGQGAHLLADPGSTLQPFYHLAPDWALFPLVGLTTVATVIASQAVITGAFSLTRQAVQLGHVPPMSVTQTSAEAHGQIYMPAVNWTLMLAAILLVLSFRTSGNLAAAYGVAVNATMAVTTVLAFRVARQRAGWGILAAGTFLLVFLAVDLSFLGANFMKIPDGGWLPIAVGLVLFTLMATWRRGNELVEEQLGQDGMSVETFIGKVTHDPPVRVPGTAVFVSGRSREVPPELVHHLRLSKSLHEQVVLLTVRVEQVPKIAGDERIEVEDLDQGFHHVTLHYGFMQGMNVPSDLAACSEQGLDVDLDDVTYYIGHKSLIAGRKKIGMAIWRDKLYALMARNAGNEAVQFQMPAGRVVEIGLQLGI